MVVEVGCGVAWVCLLYILEKSVILKVKVGVFEFFEGCIKWVNKF